MQNPLNFHVPDMTCGHCVRAISAAVRAVDADAALEFDLPAHQVRVSSATVAAPALAAALAAAGYRAELTAAAPVHPQR